MYDLLQVIHLLEIQQVYYSYDKLENIKIF